MDLNEELKQQEINNYLEMNITLQNENHKLKKLIKSNKKKIMNNNKNIYKICDHEWKNEIISSEPCGNKWEICTKCRLYYDYTL